MAEVFVGTEDISFALPGGPVPASTFGNAIDTRFVRAGVNCDNLRFVRAANWAANLSDGWARFDMGRPGTNIGAGSEVVVLHNPTGTVPILRLFTTGTSVLTAQRWDGSAWQNIGAALAALPDSTPETWAIGWRLAADGFFRVKRGGALVAEYTGDTTGSGAVVAGLLDLKGRSTSATLVFSQVIIADEDCSTWFLKTLAPNGAGTYNEAASGAYTDLDENAFSDADIVTFDAAGQRLALAVTDVGAGVENLVCAGIHVHARARKNGSGPQRLELGTRSGAGVDTYSAPQDLDTSYGTAKGRLSVAPALAELDSYQLILRAAS